MQNEADLDKALETIDYALEHYEDGVIEFDEMVERLTSARDLTAAAGNDTVHTALVTLLEGLSRIPPGTRRAEERESVEALTDAYYEAVIEL